VDILDHQCAGRRLLQLVQQGTHDQVAFACLQRVG
jgi:hypothetical protein